MLYTLYIIIALTLSLMLGVGLLSSEGHQRPKLEQAPNEPPILKREKKSAKCRLYYSNKKHKRRKQKRIARKSKQINQRIIKSKRR